MEKRIFIHPFIGLLDTNSFVATAADIQIYKFVQLYKTNSITRPLLKLTAYKPKFDML